METASGTALGGSGVAYTAGVMGHEPGTGRFMEGGRALTPKQAAFVDAYIGNGGKATAAARTAGYVEAQVEAWRLLRNRAVLAAIHEETVARVATGGAIGVGVLVKVAQDEAAPAAARVSAAKWLAEAAGHGLAARKAGELADDDRPLEERSIGELEQIAADLHAQLTRARMGVIEGESAQVQADAPNNAPAMGSEPAQA